MAAPTVEKKSLRKEFPDIQGIVLKGYKNLPYSKFVFLRIEETRGAIKWLAGVLNRVTSAAEKNPERAFNIGFTYLGLKRMGLGRATHSFPREFREGMANSARSLQLGDTGNSAPENWQVGGLFTREVHLLLAIYGKDKNATDDEYRKLIGGLLGSVFTHIYKQDAARPDDMKDPSDSWMGSRSRQSKACRRAEQRSMSTGSPEKNWMRRVRRVTWALTMI